MARNKSLSNYCISEWYLSITLYNKRSFLPPLIQIHRPIYARARFREISALRSEGNGEPFLSPSFSLLRFFPSFSLNPPLPLASFSAFFIRFSRPVLARHFARWRDETKWPTSSENPISATSELKAARRYGGITRVTVKLPWGLLPESFSLFFSLSPSRSWWWNSHYSTDRRALCFPDFSTNAPNVFWLITQLDRTIAITSSNSKWVFSDEGLSRLCLPQPRQWRRTRKRERSGEPASYQYTVRINTLWRVKLKIGRECVGMYKKIVFNKNESFLHTYCITQSVSHCETTNSNLHTSRKLFRFKILAEISNVAILLFSFSCELYATTERYKLTSIFTLFKYTLK